MPSITVCVLRPPLERDGAEQPERGAAKHLGWLRARPNFHVQLSSTATTRTLQLAISGFVPQCPEEQCILIKSCSTPRRYQMVPDGRLQTVLQGQSKVFVLLADGDFVERLLALADLEDDGDLANDSGTSQTYAWSATPAWTPIDCRPQGTFTFLERCSTARSGLWRLLFDRAPENAELAAQAASLFTGAIRWTAAPSANLSLPRQQSKPLPAAWTSARSLVQWVVWQDLWATASRTAGFRLTADAQPLVWQELFPRLTMAFSNCRKRFDGLIQSLMLDHKPHLEEAAIQISLPQCYSQSGVAHKLAGHFSALVRQVQHLQATASVLQDRPLKWVLELSPECAARLPTLQLAQQLHGKAEEVYSALHELLNKWCAAAKERALALDQQLDMPSAVDLPLAEEHLAKALSSLHAIKDTLAGHAAKYHELHQRLLEMKHLVISPPPIPAVPKLDTALQATLSSALARVYKCLERESLWCGFATTCKIVATGLANAKWSAQTLVVRTALDQVNAAADQAQQTLRHAIADHDHVQQVRDLVNWAEKTIHDKNNNSDRNWGSFSLCCCSWLADARLQQRPC